VIAGAFFSPCRGLDREDLHERQLDAVEAARKVRHDTIALQLAWAKSDAVPTPTDRACPGDGDDGGDLTSTLETAGRLLQILCASAAIDGGSSLRLFSR